jgi:hypothetical protein
VAEGRGLVGAVAFAQRPVTYGAHPAVQMCALRFDGSQSRSTAFERAARYRRRNDERKREEGVGAHGSSSDHRSIPRMLPGAFRMTRKRRLGHGYSS